MRRIHPGPGVVPDPQVPQRHGDPRDLVVGGEPARRRGTARSWRRPRPGPRRRSCAGRRPAGRTCAPWPAAGRCAARPGGWPGASTPRRCRRAARRGRPRRPGRAAPGARGGPGRRPRPDQRQPSQRQGQGSSQVGDVERHPGGRAACLVVGTRRTSSGRPAPGGTRAGRSRPARPPPAVRAATGVTRSSGPYPTATAAESCCAPSTPTACAARSATRPGSGGSGRSYRSVTRMRSRGGATPITTRLASGTKPSRCGTSRERAAGELARTTRLGSWSICGSAGGRHLR